MRPLKRVAEFASTFVPTRAPRRRVPHFAFEIRVLAIEGGRSSYHLDNIKSCRRSQLSRGVPGLGLGSFSELHLDQLVSSEGIVERRDERWSQSMLPDMDCRTKVVCLGSELRTVASLHSRAFPVLLMNDRTSTGVPFHQSRCPSASRIA